MLLLLRNAFACGRTVSAAAKSFKLQPQIFLNSSSSDRNLREYVQNTLGKSGAKKLMEPSQALLKNCGYKRAFAMRATQVFVLIVCENHPNIRYCKEILSF